MLPAVIGFDWDDGNLDKRQKHGVAIATIEHLFRNPIDVFPDPAHSSLEERFKAIGRTQSGRSGLIVFTLRTKSGKMFIRPISARYMSAKERDYYEREAAEAAARRGG
jgi:uncharacterized DUF497 family protein